VNLSTLLDMAADGFGERVVLGRRSAGYTAHDLREMSLGGAAIIRESGANGVVYLDVNGPAFPVALFAAARAGVPLVPINYRLSDGQLEKLLERHSGAVTIADSRARALSRVATVRSFSAAEWIAAARSEGDTEVTDAPDDAPAVIIYTSGTTSEPKGVILRHQNLVSYVLATVEFAGARDDEAALVSMPPYHIAAVANAITNLYAGRRCIVLDQFTGAEWLNIVRAEEVTHALVVPTMLARIVDVAGDRSVPSLRSLAYGGASMPQKVIEKALDLWPAVDFVNAYGLTETSSTISVLGPAEHRAALSTRDPVVRSRLSSAGLPVPGVTVEVRDESYVPVAAGVAGRIWVSGEQVSGEYEGVGPTLDARGFFDTRDEGYLDADGYLFIGGRSDDTIIRGGENIAPAEIEEVLLSHVDIEDAVVVGVPDIEWGEHLEAVIVAASGREVDPDEIREFVRKQLRTAKTPDRVHVWFELPRTPTGKLIRRQVLAQIQSVDADE
jgi:acyl-CoA synthetase (AMP-forming)/AMP-acid ligase II